MPKRYRKTPLNEELPPEVPPVETPDPDPPPDGPVTPPVEEPTFKPPTNSILLSVKKMLGVAEEYYAFDLDIISAINMTFLTLNQMGVGPSNPFSINSPDTTWDEFLEKAPRNQNGILGSSLPSYVYMKVRLVFDPPTNSFLVNSFEKQIQEMEWRFMAQVEWADIVSDREEQNANMVEMTPEQVQKIYESALENRQSAAYQRRARKKRQSKANLKPIDIFR